MFDYVAKKQKKSFHKFKDKTMLWFYVCSAYLKLILFEEKYLPILNVGIKKIIIPCLQWDDFISRLFVYPASLLKMN